MNQTLVRPKPWTVGELPSTRTGGAFTVECNGQIRAVFSFDRYERGARERSSFQAKNHADALNSLQRRRT
jgi:hypothetical protein